MVKKQKATVNAENNSDDESFQYALTVALNHEQIIIHPEKI